MHFIDYIIIAIIVAVVGLICYFCFWKNRKKPCHGCPYAKDCDFHCKNDKVKNKTKNNIE